MSFVSRSLLIAIVFSITGITLKLADYLGEREQSPQAYIFAVFSGILLGWLMHVGAEESSYVLGIVLGVALGCKVDRPNLFAGLLTMAIGALVLGLVWPIPWLSAAVTILSFVDEAGHDRFAGQKGPRGFLFRYRVVLKIGTIFLAFATLISPTTAVGFLCFDLSYDVMSRFVR